MTVEPAATGRDTRAESFRARFRRALLNAETWIGGLVAMSLLLMGAYELVTRYLLPTFAIAWIPEVMVYMMVWSVFLASGILVAENAHVRADLLTARAGATAARRLDAVAAAGGLLLCCVLLWQAVVVVRSNLAMATTSLSEIAFPMWLYSMSAVAGATLMGLHYTDHLWSCLVSGAADEKGLPS
jgi:TRAP-type C4-dicarboxylate transport system permease small subunit